MQSAQIIILPTLWTASGASEAGHRHNPSAECLVLDSIMTARTYENTCAVVFANAGGPPGRNYCGLLQVIAPYIRPLARLRSSARGMAVADLDMQICNDAEDNCSIRHYLANSEWASIYLRKEISSQTAIFKATSKPNDMCGGDSASHYTGTGRPHGATSVAQRNYR